MTRYRDTSYKEPIIDSDMGTLTSYAVEDFVKYRYDNDIQTFSESVEIQISKDKFRDLAKVYNLNIFEVKNNSIILKNDSMIIHRRHFSNGLCQINMFGEEHQVKELHSYFLKNYNQKTPSVRWVHDVRGDYVKCNLNTKLLPVIQMYPFLKYDSLESYYDSFMKSNSNIIILIGPPGTGKTSFIRGMMNHTGSDAVISYNPSVLENDALFAGFMSNENESLYYEDDIGSEAFMVLEDADLFLNSRTDGNTMMHRFLNVSDGLVSASNKKLIFSTNLPSINDIDTALTRNGRCFDIINFRSLDYNELVSLNKIFNKRDTIPEGSSMILSDYFN